MHTGVQMKFVSRADGHPAQRVVEKGIPCSISHADAEERSKRSGENKPERPDAGNYGQARSRNKRTF